MNCLNVFDVLDITVVIFVIQLLKMNESSKLQTLLLFLLCVCGRSNQIIACRWHKNRITENEVVNFADTRTTLTAAIQ